MITEELGLNKTTSNPYLAGLYTFIAFCVAGLIPLLPFFIAIFARDFNVFLVSIILTTLSFLIVGVIKGIILRKSKMRSSIETLIVGLGAATVAYITGMLGKSIASP